MLFSSARKRETQEAAEELERFTLAVNNGIAILRDREARRRFETARSRRAGTDATDGQSLAEYRATRARLAARFPGNVTSVH